MKNTAKSALLSILFGGLLAIGAIVVAALIATSPDPQEEKGLQPWTVVCDDGGRYNFRDGHGTLWTASDFATEAEARRFMEWYYGLEVKAGTLPLADRKAEAERQKRLRAEMDSIRNRNWKECEAKEAE